MAQTVPYLTEQQIRDKYAKALTDYTNQRNAEADRARKQVNSNFDNTQRQNYVQYMQNQKELPEQLDRMGVTGGASETSALRARTNYENNFNNTERSRGTEIGNINNTLADTLNTYRMTADQNMNDEIAQNRQLRANYEKQLQQEAEQRYANTISGYDSIGGIDKEIASIQKSGKDTWRIAYLRARRAELVAAQKAEQQALASSGGGGGYSYSSGGGGGNDDVPYVEPTKPVDTTSAATLGAVAGVLSNKKSGKSSNKSNTVKSGNVRSRYSVAGRMGNYLGGHTAKVGSAGSYQTSHRAYRRRYKK